MKRVFVIVILILCTVNTYNEPIIVALDAGAYPPWNFSPEDGHVGAYVDVLNRITELSGVEFAFVHLPPVRLSRSFLLGSIHIEPGVNPAWRNWDPEQAALSLYTIPFADSVDVLVCVPGKQVYHGDITTLYGKSLAVRRGFTYPAFTEAFAKGLITRVDTDSEFQLMKMVEAKRVDCGIVNERVARYLLQEHQNELRLKLGAVVGVDSISFRLHKMKEDFLEPINAAISTMLAGNEIHELLEAYFHNE